MERAGGELSTEPSVVVHKASGRRMSYGEIAAFAKMPAELPKIEEKDLKSPANFRLIGKDVPRVDVPSKVTGAAKYAIDVQVPDMVYAAVLQSPYPGGTPQAVDDAAARKVPGITDIVTLPEGVGVVGTTRRGDAGRQAPAQGHLVERARRAPRQRKRARRIRRDRRATRAAAACCTTGSATPRPRWRVRRACSAANTARATSITPRWSR